MEEKEKYECPHCRAVSLGNEWLDWNRIGPGKIGKSSCPKCGIEGGAIPVKDKGNKGIQDG